MRNKVILFTSFTISLFPMFMKQYGGCKGVQEITGMINLLNPIGILSVVLFLAGVWTPFHNKSVNKILGAMGVIGIVISGELSLQNSLSLAYPEFYIGLAVSVFMVMAYFIIDKVVEE